MPDLVAMAGTIAVRHKTYHGVGSLDSSNRLGARGHHVISMFVVVVVVVGAAIAVVLIEGIVLSFFGGGLYFF